MALIVLLLILILFLLLDFRCCSATEGHQSLIQEKYYFERGWSAGGIICTNIFCKMFCFLFDMCFGVLHWEGRPSVVNVYTPFLFTLFYKDL